MKKTAILMATYNGTKYLDKQIVSILNQSHSNFHIYISDDNSTDNTEDIILNYVALDNRITYLGRSRKGGAKKNFNFLMENVEADYYFFADQDDIWLPNKVEDLLKILSFYESVYDSSYPILVHGDLKLIDKLDNEIAPSLWEYQRLNPKWGESFNLILTQNIVTGCNMVVNRALLKLAIPIPEKSIMHDWWLALVACAFGRVVYTNEPGVLYRQHASNEVGAKAFNFTYIASKALHEIEDIRASMFATYRQAEEFSIKFEGKAAADIAKKYRNIEEVRGIRKMKIIFSGKFYKIGFIRNMGWIIL